MEDIMECGFVSSIGIERSGLNGLVLRVRPLGSRRKYKGWVGSASGNGELRVAKVVLPFWGSGKKRSETVAVEEEESGIKGGEGKRVKVGKETRNLQKVQVVEKATPISVEPAGRGWYGSLNKLTVGIVVGLAISRSAGWMTRKILGIKEAPKLSEVVQQMKYPDGLPVEGTMESSSNGPAKGVPGSAAPALLISNEALDLLETKSKKYIIVGGKGGVGKTSMSAALATKFADMGQTTLIVSTDPAHSLSDVFDQDVSGGSPVPVSSIEGLYAQEVNPKETVGGAGLGSNAGLEGLGLDDLSSLLETMPPGMDEAVALVEIVKFIQGDPEYSKFERIVFDTAPTGHTLRLLTLPDFLDSFFGKVMSMKSKFAGFMNQFKGMFGGGDDDPLDAEGMEDMKRSMKIVRDLFRDPHQTEFIVAAIPNMMAISESVRLVDTLRKEGIPAQHVFVNMIQPENDDCMFCKARHKEQKMNLSYLRKSFEGMQVSPVQYFDREIRGAFALRAMGRQLIPNEEDVAREPAEISNK
uniref:ArsA/GET3 Anion-transporting ATPase-like domain-containing protein n=1 Tax=Compsopogon caeruleus TaxID=31354 RepID=A0A7S1XCQ9_9RHOD|mmetsp:Transcript_17096/g.35599  ORF Transcript_17096/g.35599 Transcript_17096/m.35599 type:complete len:526 (+) Transcript_17096:675-2252(+)